MENSVALYIKNPSPLPANPASVLRSPSGNWTPQSLAVEDAAPTHVLITFPSAKTVLESDFTITGITATVLSGSWSGIVYTLVLSVDVTADDVLNVVYKGVSYSVTNNIWTPLLISSKFQLGGKISRLSSGEVPNEIVGSTDYLTIDGSIGSYTFQVPQTSAYQNADDDGVWYSSGWRTATEAELKGYDFTKTFVKYLNTSPYTFQEVWIVKAGQTLTEDEINRMRIYCHLSVWWDDTLSAYGGIKGNKPIAKRYVLGYSHEYDDAATDLIDRMIAASEEPTETQKVRIDAAIRALKTAGLFDTKFDVFVVTRGIGLASTKMNWIKDSSNAVPVTTPHNPIYHDNEGYNGGNDEGYLSAEYNFVTDAVLFSQNDASFGFRTDMDVVYGGQGCMIGGLGVFINNGTVSINNAAALAVGTLYAGKAGYNALSRASAANFNIFRNNQADLITSASQAVTNGACTICYLGSSGYFEGNVSLYFIGKSLTQSEFLTLQDIMDTYFGVTINAPAELSLKPVYSKGVIEVSFAENSNNAFEFEIERSTTNESGYALIHTLAKGLGVWEDNTVSGGSVYYYRIRAKRGSIYSDYCASYSVTMPASAPTLLQRMAWVDNVAQIIARQTAINTAIASLQANSLFGTQFDALVVACGTGKNSCLLNWIKDTSDLGIVNVSGSGYIGYTKDVGLRNEGLYAYLRTHFTPPTDAVLFTQNDACFGFKMGGVKALQGAHGQIGLATTSCIHIATFAGVGNNRFNNGTGGAGTHSYPVPGYVCLSRAGAASFDEMVNSDVYTITIASSSFANATELHLFHINYANDQSYYSNGGEVLEMYWVGKSMSQAQFLVFQGIMNTYFASL
jgi:hypothetical protein